MLPSILAKQLEKGIGDYIETTFPMTNAPFKGSLHNMLETKDSVYHEPYVHQQPAFTRLTGDDGRSTLIATGTGSGKTECFLYPILEYCYQHRGGPGIKALIIYPMNALATDQAKRIAELIWTSPELGGNVTAGMYVSGHEQNPSRMMSKEEVDFKRKKDTMQVWDPNVLSCTPTLEMGIDIGDLSTVILCSMPPAQSQFLQRTGRAAERQFL